MPEGDNNNQNHDNKNYYLSFGIAFGLLGGALFAIFIGMFIDSPLIWAFAPGLGMLMVVYNYGH
ncbi:MAG: hypothetical protein GX317_07500 [Staphylococcus equorum]|nr:hypothetical protein [Staphylococcus equorum]